MNYPELSSWSFATQEINEKTLRTYKEDVNSNHLWLPVLWWIRQIEWITGIPKKSNNDILANKFMWTAKK